jgi:hypothetical protein
MALDDQSASRGLVASLTEPDEVRALVLRYCEHGAGPASISEVSALEARTKPGLVVSQREHRSRDGAISLEALVIAEGVV